MWYRCVSDFFFCENIDKTILGKLVVFEVLNSHAMLPLCPNNDWFVLGLECNTFALLGCQVKWDVTLLPSNLNSLIIHVKVRWRNKQ